MGRAHVRYRTVSPSQAAPALRRRAPAGRPRARSRARAGGVPARRAAIESRRQAEKLRSDELKHFQRSLGTTTIYVTHDQAEAMGLGDRIAVLNQGKVCQVGTPQEIYIHPTDTFAATFIGSPPMNLVEDGATYLGFRPESFLPPGIETGDDNVAFPFRVTRVEYLGADRLVYGVLEGWRPETHVISKIPTNIRAEIAGGEKYDFIVRRSDIVRFDRATGRRRNGAGA